MYLCNEMCIDGFKVVFPNQATIVLIMASPLYILGMIPFEANHSLFFKNCSLFMHI